MVTPEHLRRVADNKMKADGRRLVVDIMPDIEELMLSRAHMGEYELDVRGFHLLNEKYDNWLVKPHLYKPVIEKLEKDGFKVSHSDDLRDGVYLIIRW